MITSEGAMREAISELSKWSERVGYALGRSDPKSAATYAEKREQARRRLEETFRNHVQTAFDQGLENGGDVRTGMRGGRG